MFEDYGVALKEAGIEHPALVLDLDAFRQNLAYLDRHLPAGYRRRIADKSLPCNPLLAEVMTVLGAKATMSFHLPLTGQVLAQFPDTDVLMGKPIPVGEAERFIANCPQAFRVTWLIDSEKRLKEYRALAADGADLNVAFEVDIGLGRGGFAEPAALARALEGIGPLTVRGLMGYEAHVNALPAILGKGEAAQRRAQARLQEFVQQLPEESRDIINTGGSTTALMLPQAGPANDLTIGSAVVKPSHFDQPCNDGLKPAMFIVSPVLKSHPHVLPGHPVLSEWLRRFRLIDPQIVFIYGGNWMAEPVWPRKLKTSPFYGLSSNQQGFTLPRGTEVPDHVILRPTQSEALISQFPNLWVYQDGRIINEWATLRA